jgi:hypothetical protein
MYDVAVLRRSARSRWAAYAMGKRMIVNWFKNERTYSIIPKKGDKNEYKQKDQRNAR